MSTLALRSRRLLLPDGPRPGTLRLRDGRVEAVLPWEAAPPEVLDEGEAVILPGLVDGHVHVNEPGRTEWEGWWTATRAAALGGVVALVDMPLNSLPVTTTRAALAEKIAATAGKLHVDVGFWGGVVPGNRGELAPMAAAGARGFKAFTCPSGIDEFPPCGEEELRAAMPELRRCGVPLLVHAELEGELRAAAAFERDDYRAWLHSRPPEWEDRAVAMVARLVEETGCAAHIVHLSSAGALRIVREAKARGLPLSAETCPHYLVLTAEEVPRGATEFKCAPPIREGRNRDALWAALRDGTLDMVVTDHSPCLPALKRQDSGDFLDAWGGIASLQLGLSSVWTEARRRGVDLGRLSTWMSAAPARLAGLPAPVLRPGASADLVVFEPETSFAVRPEDLAHRHPTTPWAGRLLRGRVRHTLLRGEFLVRDGAIVGPPRGRPLLDPRPMGSPP